MHSVRGVIFDLWNTLVYLPPGQRLRERIAEYSEFPLATVKEYMRLVGSIRHDCSYEDLCGLIYDDNGRPLTAEDMANLNRIYSEALQSVCWEPGAKEALKFLRDEGIKTAIVSNSTEFSVKVVETMQISDVVDDVALSCLTGFLKPDPRAFTSVLDKWGTGSGIIVVGDKMTTDVLGAKVLGLDVFHFNTTAPKTALLQRVSVSGIVNSMFDLPALLREYDASLTPS